MTFFVFPILQKISTVYSFLKFAFPSKICIKIFKLNISNFYLTSHPTNRLGSTSSLLLSSSWLASHGLLLWRLLWIRLLLSFLLLHADFLFWLYFFFLLFHIKRFHAIIHYIFLHKNLNFDLPQVSWIQWHKCTRILSKWIP